MTFKPFGPGSPTGGETTVEGSPGNRDYYPSRESQGSSIGGTERAEAAPGSNVPAKINAQAGPTGGVDQSILGTGGYDYNQNPTGSSLSEGDSTSPDDGVYGDRYPSSPGTNATGGGGSVESRVSNPNPEPVRPFDTSQPAKPAAGSDSGSYGSRPPSSPGTNAS